MRNHDPLSLHRHSTISVNRSDRHYYWLMAPYSYHQEPVKTGSGDRMDAHRGAYTVIPVGVLHDFSNYVIEDCLIIFLSQHKTE